MNSVKGEAAGAGEASERTPMLMGRLMKQVSRTILDEDLDGLRASHFRLLAQVAPPGLRITELAERLGMTKQACGQFVRQLTGSGHVVVQVPPDDARARLVVRTPRGDRAVADSLALMARMEDGWAERVGEQRYAAFRQVLRELLDD